MTTKSELVDEAMGRFEKQIRALNSDTATEEELEVKVKQMMGLTMTGWEREIFKEVLFNFFMVDTEKQIRRRESGEFDRIVSSVR
jgi:hypothetical protein